MKMVTMTCDNANVKNKHKSFLLKSSGLWQPTVYSDAYGRKNINVKFQHFKDSKVYKACTDKFMQFVKQTKTCVQEYKAYFWWNGLNHSYQSTCKYHNVGTVINGLIRYLWNTFRQRMTVTSLLIRTNKHKLKCSNEWFRCWASYACR